MIRLVILGATGSIGTTCLDAIRSHNLPIKVVGLTANRNNDKLNALKDEFNCPVLLTGGEIDRSNLPLSLTQLLPI